MREERWGQQRICDIIRVRAGERNGGQAHRAWGISNIPMTRRGEQNTRFQKKSASLKRHRLHRTKARRLCVATSTSGHRAGVDGRHDWKMVRAISTLTVAQGKSRIARVGLCDTIHEDFTPHIMEVLPSLRLVWFA